MGQTAAEAEAGLPGQRGQAALLGHVELLLGELPGPAQLPLPQRDVRQVREE